MSDPQVNHNRPPIGCDRRGSITHGFSDGFVYCSPCAVAIWGVLVPSISYRLSAGLRDSQHKIFLTSPYSARTMVSKQVPSSGLLPWDVDRAFGLRPSWEEAVGLPHHSYHHREISFAPHLLPNMGIGSSIERHHSHIKKMSPAFKKNHPVT